MRKPDPRASCEGKQKLTRVHAQQIVRRKTHEDGFQAYRCIHCGSWHTGSRQHTPRVIKTIGAEYDE